VIDGDTIELDGGERVRLIGVDTPETVDPRRPVEYFGKEASSFTRGLVQGKTVRLEFDQETIDSYGRTLAYVYLEDGTLLNAEIIRRGYGHAYTRFPFRYQGEFLALERQARAEDRGLWVR
jgi:micrococcal nuclease